MSTINTYEKFKEAVIATGAEYIATDEGHTKEGKPTLTLLVKNTSFDNWKVCLALAEQYFDEGPTTTESLSYSSIGSKFQTLLIE